MEWVTLKSIFTAAAITAGLGGCTALETYAPAGYKWRTVAARIKAEESIYRDCAQSKPSCPSPLMTEWQRKIKEAAGKPPKEQLDIINGFINERPYMEEEENYGRRDYWASPLEFFMNGGDCEDYAIAKYVSLRRLGFTAEQMRLHVIKHEDGNHAILSVRLGDETYFLDNIFSTPVTKESIGHYKFLQSVNDQRFVIHNLF